MSDRTPPDDAYPDSDTPGGPGFSLPAALARRWPLVAVGLAVGVLIGVLIHLTSTRQYQSSAQVLVVKKRDFSSSGNIGQAGAVDDYVAAQLTIIKSEQVRLAAATEVRKLQVNTPLPEDDAALAEVIRAGLVAVRDKEGTVPGTVGSGIVLLSFRFPEPNDAKQFLDAVIKAYQGVLSGVYDITTRTRIETTTRAMKAAVNDKKLLVELRIVKTLEKNKIMDEEPASVRGRVTALLSELNKLEIQKLSYESNLSLIKKAGTNAADRQKVLAQLTGLGRQAAVNQPQGLEQTRTTLQGQREALAQRYGRLHPEMIALDAQIKFYDEMNTKLNPNGTERLDDLDAVKLKFEQERDTAVTQIARFEAQLAKDKAELAAVGRVQAELDSIDARLPGIEKEIGGYEQDLRTADVTSGAGGYEANAVTKPGYGGQVAPVVLQSVLLGLAAGLALGGGAAAVAELTDKSFKSPAEIRRRLGLPVIGHIPQFRDADPDPGAPAGVQPALVTALRPKSGEAEAYRGVRTQLYFSTQGRGHQVIQVTSPNPGDGKSTLAANLAASIAQSGKRTVLIDCDFRKPQVHKIFGLGTVEHGLSSVVAGTAPIAKALRRSAVENLDLMPCGTRPENPAELLTSPQFQDVLASLKDAYDFVIVDTPPLLAVSDPGAVAPRVDGVILVFRMTKGARPSAERAREQLGQLGANVLGVVVNGGAGGVGYNYGSNAGYQYVDYEYAENYTHDDDETPAPTKAR